MRLLIICFISLAGALGLIVFGNGDQIAQLKFGKYHIESSMFTLTVLFILGSLCLMSLLKVISYIFNLPYIIHKTWETKKLYKANESLIQAVGQHIVGNKKKSLELIDKIKMPKEGHGKEIQTLLKGENSQDLDQQIEAYGGLINSKEYKFYAYKRLASIYYNKKFYQQAEEYAVKAFDSKSDDSEVLEILIHCYAYLEEWHKFDYVVSKLRMVNSNKLNGIADEVAKYYINAAKTVLEAGDDEDAETYIESSLELSPGYIDAVDLYVALALSNNKYSQAIKMLKLSFQASPSLEIAQMYANLSKDPPDVIFDELSSLVKNSKGSPLFLSIAASMNLLRKVDAQALALENG